jgi:PPP family 3-phenylpropionic acid transporter
LIVCCGAYHARLRFRDRVSQPTYTVPRPVGALYAAFGVQSPYLPSLLDSHGLPPETIALVLAAGTVIRLVAGPAAGHLADRLDAPKAVLIVCSAAAGLIALGYLPARGLWPLLIVGVIHSAALAPLAPLSDTLALGSAARVRLNDPRAHGFYYGWLRGAGSAAFILGTVLSGQAIGRFGIITVVWLNAGLLANDGVCCSNCPSIAAHPG